MANLPKVAGQSPVTVVEARFDVVVPLVTPCGGDQRPVRADDVCSVSVLSRSRRSVRRRLRDCGIDVRSRHQRSEVDLHSPGGVDLQRQRSCAGIVRKLADAVHIDLTEVLD
jgi:hypothetical protein